MKNLFLTAAAVAALAGSSFSFADTHATGVPQLTSRSSGAAYTIFIDFAGFNYTGSWGQNQDGTANNTIPGVLTPYLTNSNNANNSITAYTAAQQATIAGVWARVAEAYAPFNINVTTVDPAIAAGQAGTDSARQRYYDRTNRVEHTIITGNNSSAFGNAGGISFVGTVKGSFDSTANSGSSFGYHTNFVFEQGTGGPKGAGVAASHEDGHAFSLNHQIDRREGGTSINDYSSNNGSGEIAPYMGIGYGSERSTFRSGRASGGGLQNDVSAMLSYGSSNTASQALAIAADGIGQSRAAATPLTLTGTGGTRSLAAGKNEGVIVPLATNGTYNPIGESNYSSDFFSFTTGGGALSLTESEGSDRITAGLLDNASNGINDAGGTLDSVMRLLDSSGNIIVSTGSDSGSFQNVINTSLLAGTYYVQIASAGGKESSTTVTEGTATYTDIQAAEFYDLGSYFLTGTIAVPEPMSASVLGVASIAIFARRRRVA